jgi:hypothetical protein
MRLSLYAAAVICFSSLGGSQPHMVSVHVSTPTPAGVVRIVGPAVNVLGGKPIRSEKGMTLISTPADLSIDVTLGDFYFQLDRDSGSVDLVVNDGHGHRISAGAEKLVVRFKDGELQVAGVPAVVRQP